MAVLSIPFDDGETLRTVKRFMIVGMTGTLLDVALFSALHVGLGIPTLAANTLSFEAGGTNNFILHRYWTYAQRPRNAVATQFLRFALVNSSALLVNNLLLFVLAPFLHTFISAPGYSDFLAKAGASGVVVGWNFIVNNFWTFRTHLKGV